MELAILFPKGHSLHVPSDGRPLTPSDARMALAKWQSSGAEMPWALTHKKAGPMLASLTPGSEPHLQHASLTSSAPAPAEPAAKPSFAEKPESLARQPSEPPEPQLAEEGEEQEDDIALEPLPATFLLTEKPLSRTDLEDDQAREPVLKKIALLISPPSVLASEEFDSRLQIEDLYEANIFKGPAIAFMRRQKARIAAIQARSRQAMR
jgi:hypothetical protein